MFRGMLLFFSCLAGQRQCLRCNRDVKPPCVRETFFFEICSWFALALGSRGRVRFFLSLFLRLRIQRLPRIHLCISTHTACERSSFCNGSSLEMCTGSFFEQSSKVFFKHSGRPLFIFQSRSRQRKLPAIRRFSRHAREISIIREFYC